MFVKKAFHYWYPWDYNLIYLKIIKAHCGSHDIHYGINGAYLVKMNFANGSVMGLCLGLRQDVKDLQGQGACPFTHIQNGNDIRNILKVSVMMPMTVIVFMMVIIMMVIFQSVVIFMVVVSPSMVIFMVVASPSMVVFMVAASPSEVVFLMFCRTSVEIGHVVVMVIMFLIQYHVKVTAVDTRFLDPADLSPEAFILYPGKGLHKDSVICPEIQKSCNSHVSAYSGAAFQI